MTHPLRHTEELAVESLYGTGEDDPGLLNRLLTLTSGEPTTEELEEALMLTERQVLPTLRAWISSRHILNGRRNIQGETGLKLAAAMSTREFLDKLPPAQVLDPDTEAAFDQLEAQAIERAHPTPGGLHSIFETITNPMRKPA
jgi:hypothetical protein